MISTSSGRILLIVACALGVIQGMMILVGGIIAARAKNSDLDDYYSSDRYEILKDADVDTKYHCGLIRVKPMPLNPTQKSLDCNNFGKMDRGWFKRVHDYCNGSDEENLFNGRLTIWERKEIAESDLCKLEGYKYTLALSITSGVGWILCGVVAGIAAAVVNKLVALVACGLFVAFYAAFVALFAVLWQIIGEFNKSCLNKLCKDARRQGKRASYEVLAYSVCSFVLILAAIICCFLGTPSFDERFNAPKTCVTGSGEAASDNKHESFPSATRMIENSEIKNNAKKRDYTSKNVEKESRTSKEASEESEAVKNVKEDSNAGKNTEAGVEGNKDAEEQNKDAKDEADKDAVKDGVMKSVDVNQIGKEHLEMFKKFNKYKMQHYADKMFD
eukprot:TRINITY_DN6035_c0_g1_i1.p1 TRINITY_DN6035_c0_g1~~TRINITY_DN6035_c0_g1_i1.p1  ORF type:complete len:388 (-),score=93.89 TRINITY_DN6035_c0_g1_i1:215-1378(-)